MGKKEFLAAYGGGKYYQNRIPRLEDEPLTVDFFKTKDTADLIKAVGPEDAISIARHMANEWAKSDDALIVSGEIAKGDLIPFEERSKTFYATRGSEMDVDKLYLVDKDFRDNIHAKDLDGLEEVVPVIYYRTKGVAKVKVKK